MAEILLKVALNTTTQPKSSYRGCLPQRRNLDYLFSFFKANLIWDCIILHIGSHIECIK
jgi:hypothetical protein